MNVYAHARTYVCTIVVNYCSCVLNKIMPPKGGSERSELTPCNYYYIIAIICILSSSQLCYLRYNT